MDYSDIKKKVRKLKKLEINIRYGDSGNVPNTASLVWNDFFNLNDTCQNKAKYSISSLEAMNKSEYHYVVEEFFYTVYFRFYRESGMWQTFTYDPEMLAHLNLPYNAGHDDIKRRFRELSKKYHPDNGGDSTEFIKLTDNYKKLIDNN